MRFLTHLSNLVEQYGSNKSFTDNQVCLLGLHNPPHIADHFVYAPMPKQVVQYLIQSYCRPIPEDLLTLYAFSNGIDMFRTMRKISAKISLPASRLSIFGVPLLADRKHIEPLNICLEDLSRLSGTPENWLKFGCFREISQGELTNEYDLYVDTDVCDVYQVSRSGNSLSIIRSWQSIDVCLCDFVENEISNFRI